MHSSYRVHDSNVLAPFPIRPPFGVVHPQRERRQTSGRRDSGTFGLDQKASAAVRSSAETLSEHHDAGKVHSLLSGLDLGCAIDISLSQAALPRLSELGRAMTIASMPVSLAAASPPPPDTLYQLTNSMNNLVQQQLSGTPSCSS